MGKKIVKEQSDKNSLSQKATRIPNESTFVKVFYSTIFKRLHGLKKLEKSAASRLLSNKLKISVDDAGCYNAEKTNYAEQTM
jgi:hypothetical protein